METTCRRHQTFGGTKGALLALVVTLLGLPIGVATPAAQGQTSQAVNFGGPQIDRFSADDPGRADGAAPWSTEAVIDTTGVANPAPQAVYQTGLSGRISHTFRSLIAGHTYTLRIHYAEVFATGPRERMSNVYINGNAVRSNYDVFGATGVPYTATVQEYSVIADERGQVTVTFLPVDRWGGGVCVAAIEIAPYNPPGPQPAGWWRFDEISGPTAKDAMGLHNGTVQGASRTIGRLGGALAFDGNNDFVRIDNASILLVGKFSLSCWVRGTNSGRVIASIEGGENLLMASPTNGALATDLGAPNQVLSSRPRITDNAWHNLWVVFDGLGRGVYIYADGKRVDVIPAINHPGTRNRPLYLGARSSPATGTSNYWNGSIDDVRIYDQALTEAEIIQIWEEARSTQTVLYYSGPKPSLSVKGGAMPEAVPLSLNLDEQAAMGAVVRSEATEKEIRDFARAAGFTDIHVLEPDNIVLLDLPAPLDRPGLARRARQIRSVLQEPGARAAFSDIGMVVRPGEATTPMLVLDDFVVQFKESISLAEINQLNTANGVETVWKSPYVFNLFVLRVTDRSKSDAIDMANQYNLSSLTQYAIPNFVAPVDLRQGIPDDELFGHQWYLHNTGQNGGTPDADIDAPEAWNITTGRARDGRKVVIAVIDAGFDTSHPGLKQNLWENTQELAGRPGVDDDGNGYIDDIHGWDFGTDTSRLPVHMHGTAAAGCAGARPNNGIGVTGSCPDGSLMLLSYGSDNATKVKAIDYAWANGADVISISWGYFSDTTQFQEMEAAVKRAASLGRKGRGCIILFAMTNTSTDNGGSPYDISALEEVIGVSRATNYDIYNPGGYGKCMDILGPSHGGSLSIATTDNQSEDGYNTNGIPTVLNCPSWPGEASNVDYTLCFNGTSAACPIVAGVAGLVLSVAPELSRLQVQRLLQDTADKVEDSKGKYSEINGFSNWPTGVATHGYGRVNAFEAVRVVGPRDKGGRGGVDIFVRDNRLDWGNTEQPSYTLFERQRGFMPYWNSPDIKIDVESYQNSKTFDSLTDEAPLVGKRAHVWVRVRNRGPQSASNVSVKLYWCHAEPNQEPDLPADFWTRFPADSTDTTHWKPLGTKKVAGAIPYTGSSVAGTGADTPGAIYFDLNLVQQPGGPCCLLAITYSDQDPVSSTTKNRTKIREVVSFDNNIAERSAVIRSP